VITGQTWETEVVPERCTCGATLPPDALFCHRCGKPQRELIEEAEPEPEVVMVVTPPPMPVVAASPPIGFHNGPAVRIGLMVAVLSILASAIAGRLVVLQALAPLWLVAAGFISVYLYRRRTGQKMTALNGAHLGWICGIFGFVIATLMLTLIAFALSDPNVVSAMRDQWKDYGNSEADLNHIIDAVRNPTKIAAMLLSTFLLFTVLPAFGGALGAKLLDRD
jgi:hypothetical protein